MLLSNDMATSATTGEGEYEYGRKIKEEVESFVEENDTPNSVEKCDTLQVITSRNEFHPEQIKSEDIDVVYHDLKSECLEEIKEGLYCEVCGGNVDFFNPDTSKGSCNCQCQNESNAMQDSGIFFHETHEETVAGKEEEVISEYMSSTSHEMLHKTGEINVFSSGNYLSSVRQSRVHEENESSSKNLNEGINAKLVENKHTEILPVSSIKSSISKKHIDTKLFQCTICSKSFILWSNVKKHERWHTSEKLYQCKICPKLFVYSSQLTKHEKIHNSERLFQCEICSKSFTYHYILKRHKKIHTGERPFQCKVCSKSFTVKSNLKLHEKIHTGKKPFQCKICSKSFIHCFTLNKHQKIHTGNKPFQCKICLKSFFEKGRLKLHETIHTGEKPFQCNVCSKSFTYRYILKRHETIHTGEKPFQCKICSKSFSQNSNLKSHLKIHSGIKPFQCKICSKSYLRGGDLKRHEKIHC